MKNEGQLKIGENESLENTKLLIVGSENSGMANAGSIGTDSDSE